MKSGFPQKEILHQSQKKSIFKKKVSFDTILQQSSLKEGEEEKYLELAAGKSFDINIFKSLYFL